LLVACRPLRHDPPPTEGRGPRGRDTLAAAAEGNAAALAETEAELFAATKGRSDSQRPSMGQDMVKGRRTEIEFLNGFVVDKGRTVGIDARANALLTDVVKKVERGELQQSPENITGLRLN
jgi:2-dehydropantoate 2-reductase